MFVGPINTGWADKDVQSHPREEISPKGFQGGKVGGDVPNCFIYK